VSKIAQEMQRYADEQKRGVIRAAIDKVADRWTAKPRAPLKRTKLKSSPKTKAKKREQSKTVTAVRDLVFALDRACICGRCAPSLRDQMHELVSRAKTRGRPPKDRFSTANCVRVSPACHQDITERRCTVAWGDTRMANGTLTLTWADGRVSVYSRAT